MEVIPINKLKEIFISKITDEIKKMNENDFLNLCYTIPLFNKEELLTFESLDKYKIEITFLNGIISLLNFLKYLIIDNDKKDYIELNLKCIKRILENNF